MASFIEKDKRDDMLLIKGSGGGSGFSKLCVIVVLLVTVIISVAIGIGIGYAIRDGKDGDEKNKVETRKAAEMVNEQQQKDRYSHHRDILMSMGAKAIEDNLKDFSSSPHPPGSPESKQLTDRLKTLWESQGFDHVERFKYNIYLSYPTGPGEITMHDESMSNNETMTINKEPPLDPSEEKDEDKLLYPFNAFAVKGQMTAEVVYVNYCRESDFKKVTLDLGINVKNKITICRYGKSSRTMKTIKSEEFGAIGMILFTDPLDHTYPGQEYPTGWMLNQYGVQRGTINRLSGDALSLGYPSKDNYFRIGEEKYSDNPKIPVQPISYGEAYKILRWMHNDTVTLPKEFQGGLNFTYRMQSSPKKLTFNVKTKLETRDTYTVCGTIYGNVEPDRYIMIGNHRDAWTYGACDPNSGTATMMEIARTLGHYKKVKGWRPRRSLMACSWGAEESGIQGSIEWADEHHKFLKEKVVIYLNVDMAVEGNFTVRLKALDFVMDGVFKAANIIPAPDDSSKTLYEDWREKTALLKNKSLEEIKKPIYTTPTSGSDYKALWHAYGTPILDYRYYFSRIDFPNIPQNGHYHTRYESFGWMSKFVDPGFIHHLAIGRLWLGHALVVADSNLLPLDLHAYAKQLKYYTDKFIKRYNDTLTNNNISLEHLVRRVEALIQKAEAFHTFVNEQMKIGISLLQLRIINDKLMNFERSFLVHGLLPNPVTRHVVYATTYFKLYNEKFPGISEAIYWNTKKNEKDWDNVRKQVMYVIWCLDTAIRSLDVNEKIWS